MPDGQFLSTFSLVTQLVVVLSQLRDELSSLQLDFRMGGQVIGGGVLSDHSVGLDVQIPVDPEDDNNVKVNPQDVKRCKKKAVRLQHSHSWSVGGGGKSCGCS